MNMRLINIIVAALHPVKFVAPLNYRGPNVADTARFEYQGKTYRVDAQLFVEEVDGVIACVSDSSEVIQKKLREVKL